MGTSVNDHHRSTDLDKGPWSTPETGIQWKVEPSSRKHISLVGVMMMGQLVIIQKKSNGLKLNRVLDICPKDGPLESWDIWAIHTKNTCIPCTWSDRIQFHGILSFSFMLVIFYSRIYYHCFQGKYHAFYLILSSFREVVFQVESCLVASSPGSTKEPQEPEGNEHSTIEKWLKHQINVGEKTKQTKIKVSLFKQFRISLLWFFKCRLMA